MVQYWEPGTQYNFGDIVEYEGHRYKIVQPHESQSDWTPPVTPALWGRLSDEDHNCHQHQPQQQYHAPAAPSYAGGSQHGASNDEKQSYQANPSSGGQEHKDEKKHWWDEKENQKKLEVGGGLLAGVAAVGAGIFAYKEHEKKKEEHKSQQWAHGNWLEEARARTQEYRNDGPRGPATWVLTHGKTIPQGAVVISNDPYNMYTCRAYIDGGLQLGKASPEFQKGGVIGYKNDEVHVEEYEILLGDMRGLRWVSSSGKIHTERLGARPVEGGKENDGTPLYIVRAYHKDAVHPGKASPNLNGAYIPWGGAEKEVHEYEVLCYA